MSIVPVLVRLMSNQSVPSCQKIQTCPGWNRLSLNAITLGVGPFYLYHIKKVKWLFVCVCLKIEAMTCYDFSKYIYSGLDLAKNVIASKRQVFYSFHLSENCRRQFFSINSTYMYEFLQNRTTCMRYQLDNSCRQWREQYRYSMTGWKCLNEIL